MTVNAKPSARESLIHALIDLLHKKTFYKISVNELCAAAQVSRSAFTHILMTNMTFFPAAWRNRQKSSTY